MKPAPFELHRPATLAQALTLLADLGGEARLIAGGQTLVPAMNLRLATPAHLIDIHALAELTGVTLVEDNGMPRLRIGAVTRQSQLLADPLVRRHALLLTQAIACIGHLQTRSRGTIGGSLCHADPAAELGLCLVTLGATLSLRNATRVRQVHIRDFLVDAMTTALDADEILGAIEVPLTPPGSTSVFRELARRHGDFALVAVAAVRTPGAASVAIGGIEAVPRPCPELARLLSRPETPAAARIAAAIDADLAPVKASSDPHVSGTYRMQLARVLLEDVVNEVCAA